MSAVPVGVATTDARGELSKVINNLLIIALTFGNALAGMEDGGVVAAAERVPDRGQG